MTISYLEEKSVWKKRLKSTQMRMNEAKKEGMEENKKDIAKNMLDSGENEEKILKYTGITQ